MKTSGRVVLGLAIGLSPFSAAAAQTMTGMSFILPAGATVVLEQREIVPAGVSARAVVRRADVVGTCTLGDGNGGSVDTAKLVSAGPPDRRVSIAPYLVINGKNLVPAAQAYEIKYPTGAPTEISLLFRTKAPDNSNNAHQEITAKITFRDGIADSLAVDKVYNSVNLIVADPIISVAPCLTK